MLHKGLTKNVNNMIKRESTGIDLLFRTFLSYNQYEMF